MPSGALPLPLVPQLVGLEIALQSDYAPTSGPLGLDLSNGIWARIAPFSAACGAGTPTPARS